MDPSLLLRLGPAVLVAVLVATVVVPGRRRTVGWAFDEVVRALLVGLVAGRLGWLLLGGPDVWRTALSTVVLVRAGVVTGLGVLVAGAWLARSPEERPWRLRAAVPVALAGVGAWQALCQVEGTCGGVAVSWGVRLPGRAVPAFPASYVEAALALVLAGLAWRWVRRGRPDLAWWAAAAWAIGRVALGFARPALVAHPTQDQVWFALVALVAAAVAARVAPHDGRRWVDGMAVRCDPGDGPVLLLAPGAGSSVAFLEEAFGAPVRAAGWRLATMDLRGHGDSAVARDVADHALDRHARDLAAVATAVGATVVGGVSLGGMAAVRAVHDGQVAAAAVLAVIPGWTDRAAEGDGPHAAVAEEVRRDGVDGMLGRIEASDDMPAWIREVVVRDGRRHDPASLAAVLLSLDGGEAPTLAEVGSLDVPLALVAWPDDPGHPVEVARQWHRAAARSVLVETSIAAMQDDRTAFGAAAVRALEGLDVRPRD